MRLVVNRIIAAPKHKQCNQKSIFRNRFLSEMAIDVWLSEISDLVHEQMLILYIVRTIHLVLYLFVSPWYRPQILGNNMLRKRFVERISHSTKTELLEMKLRNEKFEFKPGNTERGYTWLTGLRSTKGNAEIKPDLSGIELGCDNKCICRFWTRINTHCLSNFRFYLNHTFTS